MRVEQDIDYCEVCEFAVRDGGKHSDEKHGSGRYGVGGDLRQESEAEVNFSSQQ